MSRRLKKGVKKKLLVIFSGLMIFIVAGYLVLCVVAGSNDYMANTTINGIEVGDMTKEEAAKALEEKFESDTQDLVLNLKVKDKTFDINLKDNVSIDALGIAQNVSDDVEGNFFMRGYHYLSSNDYIAPVTVKDEEKLAEEIKKSKITDYDTRVVTTYDISESDKQITFQKGTSGEKVEEKDVIENIKTSLKAYQFKDIIECSVVNNPLDENEMANMHKELNKDGKNATLKLEGKNSYEILDSQVGVKYDLETAQKAYDKADEGTSFSINVEIQQPKISKEDLEKNLFKDVLGSYSTYVSGSYVRRNNVRLAGIKCNKIMLSGDVFSYNGTVGKRTKANGFGEAGAYVNGETVDVVGGGVCQASSTLYNAVLLSNLEIVERRNHSYVSSYVPLGRDATVSWGGPDFKFKNDSDYPIKIVMSYSGNRLKCKIYGTNVDNTTVKIKSVTLSQGSYETKYVDDPTLEIGKEKVDVSGYAPAKAQTYRYVYKNGKLVSSNKEAYSSYKRRDKVVLRGTKQPEVQPTDPNATTPTTPNTTTQSETPVTQ